MLMRFTYSTDGPGEWFDPETENMPGWLLRNGARVFVARDEDVQVGDVVYGDLDANGVCELLPVTRIEYR